MKCSVWSFLKYFQVGNTDFYVWYEIRKDEGEMISLLSRKNGKTLEAIHVCSRVKSVGFQIISVASRKDKIVLHG